jgi:shikimate dehydrogenase
MPREQFGGALAVSFEELEGLLPTKSRLLLGLVGAGIQASRTPAMQEREASAHGLHCLYQLLDLDRMGGGAAALPLLLDAAERVGFAGLNITHPCKQTVLAHLSASSDEACDVGAVNTVVFRDGGRVGHNTDWLAFRRSAERGLSGARLEHVVQLGAGGAGAATAYAVLKMGAGRLDVVDTEGSRAEALATRLDRLFPGRVRACADPVRVLLEADGLIHATSTGMAALPGLPLPAALLRPQLWVADVVYFPLETELLRTARAVGCRTLDGSGMAVWQAVEAFRLFTGLTADPDRMRTFFDEAGRR